MNIRCSNCNADLMPRPGIELCPDCSKQIADSVFAAPRLSMQTRLSRATFDAVCLVGMVVSFASACYLLLNHL